MWEKELYGYTLQELLPEVQRLCEKYTGKESTSVTYETAEKLMEAVLYFIREALGQENGRRVMTGGGKPPASELCALGRRLTEEKTRAALRFYNSLLPGFCSFGSRAYDDTVVKGIPEFFRWYDTELKPQENIVILDYPVLVPLEGYCGIDRIERFLQAVETEQRFLQSFPKGYVEEILREAYPEYETGIMNLCEAVLERLAIRYLASVCPEDLEEKIAETSKDSLQRSLEKFLKEFVAKSFDREAEIFEYLAACLPDIAVRMQTAAVHGQLLEEHRSRQ